MDFSKRYKTDKDAESEGVWEDCGEGLRVKVARANNPHHQRVIENMMRPYRRQISNGSLSNEKMTEITVKAMAECLLIDWEGVEIDGKNVPYSRRAPQVGRVLERPLRRDPRSGTRKQRPPCARKKA